MPWLLFKLILALTVIAADIYLFLSVSPQVLLASGRICGHLPQLLLLAKRGGPRWLCGRSTVFLDLLQRGLLKVTISIVFIFASMLPLRNLLVGLSRVFDPLHVQLGTLHPILQVFAVYL